MQILNKEEIKFADEYTIQHEPITSLELMERAARACVMSILKKVDDQMPIYVLRHHKDGYDINRISPNPISIGINTDKQTLDCIELQLEENDAIYSFSDGIIDQFGGDDGKKFSIKNFEKLLHEIQPFTMEAQKRKIEKAFDAWKGNNWYQVDDVIVMGVKVK